ncbi:putative ubiquitin fusion degradation protein C12B10.01c [Trichinella spiralis]|uniref:Ubiquitin fusion degradation protein C12B10.01c n=1 Tax=Trichinella spiralis TaxID=6334 RepID=A0ABR3KFV7_TRISP
MVTIKFGRRTIVAYDVEEDYQKDDRHTVTVVGTESAIAEHNFSSIRKEFYTNTIDIKFSDQANKSLIYHAYLLAENSPTFFEQKMNLGDDKAALLYSTMRIKNIYMCKKSKSTFQVSILRKCYRCRRHSFC